MNFIKYFIDNHDWVQGTEYEEDFENFYDEVTHQDRFERTNIEIEKKGMFIGKYCFHPLIENLKIPIYIGNFVFCISF